MAFKELVHKILEQIKNEPYFQWLGKMGETHPGGIKAYITCITGRKVTPLNSVKCSRIIWSN